MRERIDPCKGNSSQRKNSKSLPLCYLFFPPSLLPFSLCLLSKTTWANIASCHIKAIPCILQRGEFCSWMERHSSQTPNQRLHTWGVKTEKKKKKKPFSIWTRVCALRTNLLQHTEGSFPCNNWTNRYGWNARGRRSSKFRPFKLFKNNIAF